MHELGLCASIVDAIEHGAGDRPMAKVRVRVGRLHHVHPEAFDQSFLVAAQGTIAEDARAELVLIPVGARCGSCPAGHRHAAGPAARGSLRGREPVHEGREGRGQPTGTGRAGRGVRAATALRVAGARLHLAER